MAGVGAAQGDAGHGAGVGVDHVVQTAIPGRSISAEIEVPTAPLGAPALTMYPARCGKPPTPVMLSIVSEGGCVVPGVDGAEAKRKGTLRGCGVGRGLPHADLRQGVGQFMDGRMTVKNTKSSYATPDVARRKQPVEVDGLAGGQQDLGRFGGTGCLDRVNWVSVPACQAEMGFQRVSTTGPATMSEECVPSVDAAWVWVTFRKSASRKAALETQVSAAAAGKQDRRVVGDGSVIANVSDRGIAAVGRRHGDVDRTRR